MLPFDNIDYRLLNSEYREIVAAQRQVIENLREDKAQLIKQISKMEERLKRLEEKFSKQEVEITTLKKERDLQNKRNNMIDNEIAKTSDFRKRYERELGLLGVLKETKQFEKLDKQKFQEENK